MAFRQTVWSPIEEEYLKKNRHNPSMQLTVALAKSKYAITKKLKELDGGKVATKIPKKGIKSKIGKRKDCKNLFFRSSWEANVYRLMSQDKNISLIEYEPTTFSFTEWGILKGTVSYTPDFKITFKNGSYNWIEVKGGFMRSWDKTKLRRFKKYFPKEFAKLVGVTPGPKSKTTIFFKEQGIEIKWNYLEINKEYKKVILNWE